MRCKVCFDRPFGVQQEAAIASTAPKKTLSLWRKITYSLLLLIVVAGVAGVGGHFFIKSITSPEKTVQPIYNSLLNSDEKTLFENVTLPKEVKYDAQSYIEYIKDQNMDSFLQTLTHNANSVHTDGIISIIEHEDGSELFRLKKEKFLYFYPVVKVIAISSEVKLVTDLKDATFSFDNKDYPLDGDTIKIGSFLPGNYSVTATSKDQFIPHSADWSVSISTTDKTNEISLMAADTMIVLDGEEPDSVVYINGVSTNKSVLN